MDDNDTASADVRYFADGRPMLEIAPHHYVNKASAIALGFIRGTYRRKTPRVAANDNRPPLPSKFEVLPLDGKQTEWRYMSLTAQLAQYLRVRTAFADIIAGRLVPTKYPPVTREPLPLPIHYGRDGRWHLSPGHSSEWHGPPPGRRARATAIWATLPENDSDIFVRAARTENPKLGHLAEKLAPLLKWARGRKPLPLDATNWLEADNDSYFDGEAPAPKPATNLERRIRPGSSEEELKSWVKAYHDGKLRFSNGEKSEACYVMKDGKAVLGSVRMPAGAILYQPDKFGELLGPEPDPDEEARRLSYWTSLMSWDATTSTYRELESVRHLKAGRMRRKVLMTQAEQLEVLATKPHPPVTYCRPGLPCGHDDIGAQFVGGWISQTKGKAGSEPWQGISGELSRQAEFERWANSLPPEEQKALNLACTAANLREIGEAFGKTGKNAERYGRTILLAANDNLAAVQAA